MLLKIPTANNRLKLVTVDIQVRNKSYWLFSAFDQDLINELRAFQGGKWDKEDRCWKFPISERNRYALEILMGNYPERYYDNSLRDHYLEVSKEHFPELFPWQHEGFAFIASRKRCLLAEEMGLGKTLTCIRVMDHFAHFSCLNWWLVAPYGAQKTWERELIKWKATIGFVVITSYESLHRYIVAAEKPPQGIIFDETIKIKNPTAQRSQYAFQIAQYVREMESSFIIGLSGKPAPKEPTDWWHQLECIQPGFIKEGDIYKFKNRLANIEYEEGEYGRYPVIVSWKEDEVEKLGRRLAPIVLVKFKKDCLELPDKIHEQIRLAPSRQTMDFANTIVATAESGIMALERLRELSDGFQYTGDEDEQSDEGCGSSGDDILSHFTWIGSPKLDVVNELLDYYDVENAGCGRLVIYAWFRATIEYLQNFIKKQNWYCESIVGGKKWDAKILEDFERYDGNMCLVANPGCVYGLNFQRTEALVYYSNSFSPDHRVQSLERRDRPGADVSKGTRIIDLIHLDTDQMILDKITKSIELHDITLEEIKRCLNLS